MGLSKSKSEMIQGGTESGTDCWTCEQKLCQFKCVSQCTFFKECVVDAAMGGRVSSDNNNGLK